MHTHHVCRARRNLPSQELLQLFSPLSVSGPVLPVPAVDVTALTFIALPAVSSQSPLELGNSGYFFFQLKNR